MIRYALLCSQQHEFDAWFNNSSGFDRLSEAGEVVCPVCADTTVRKALMAPAIGRKTPSGDTAAAEEKSGQDGKGENANLMNSADSKLAALRREIENTHEYVGNRFAEEARKIHFGEVEHRGIYGDATKEQARELVDEGVQFTPLPFPSRLDA